MKFRQTAIFSVISIGVIFLVLFGIISLGVYTENNLVQSIDLTLINIIQSNITEEKTRLVMGLTEIGNIRLIIVLTIGIVLFLFIKKRYVTGFWFGGTILLWAAIGTKLIKKGIDRTRPDILPLVEKTTESFPSGHATSTTIFYGLVGLALILFTSKLRKRFIIGFVTLSFIGFILITRVYLGAHFPTDVIGGFLYGCAAIFISVGVYDLIYQPLQQAGKRFGLSDRSEVIFHKVIRREQQEP